MADPKSLTMEVPDKIKGSPPKPQPDDDDVEGTREKRLMGVPPEEGDHHEVDASQQDQRSRPQSHHDDEEHYMKVLLPLIRMRELSPEDGNHDEVDANERDQTSPPHGSYFDGRRINRVPAQLMRMNKESYAPKMVSFGPYNHGMPELAVAGVFKLKVLDMFVSQTGKSREELVFNVFQVIDQIRLCYDGITEDVLDDVTLAKIMVLDTFFLIYLMQKAMRDSKLNIDIDKFLIEKCLGSAAIPFLYTDMLLLDNQIPLSIINLFISLIHQNTEAEEREDATSFVLRYTLEGLLMDDNNMNSFPAAKDGKQPLHLLDACWRLIAGEYFNGTQVRVLQVDPPEAGYKRIIGPFRSVSDLKAKGVCFKPIDSQCVRHIKFDSWKFFGKLQLPILLVDASAKVIYSNLIAYEMSPGSTSQLVITSYINFMKSLMVTPKDVHELREKGILLRTHDSDEHVIKQFKEIDTYGLDNPDVFYAVKNEIENHCKRKAGTWMAELVYSYFRSPWTLIALLAATLLLCLTTIQAYFAVNPAS